MIQQQRHARILTHLADNEFLSVEEAVRLFDSSPATIRRDFNDLSDQNLCRRTRGGIQRVNHWSYGVTPFALREVRFAKEKDALARRAVTLLKPGDAVIVDGGTTTFHLIHCLPNFPLHVITNSLRLASLLGEKNRLESQVEVFLTGGHLYPQSGQLIGPQARAGLSQYYAHWAFLSVGGIDENSLYYSNELVVETEQAMMANADRVAVLADHSKIGTRAMCHLCPIDQVDVLITDSWPSHEPLFKQIREVGVEVITVDV